MNRRGFTLIELMIVVVILGILTALAIPRFRVSSYKAKEKEADTILKQVYQLQRTYFARHSTFAATQAALETVGFEAPAHLEFYTIPGAGDYALPLCMQAKGSWNNRSVDADGTIADC